MALVAIAAYVLAVGGQPSVVRAGVAGGLACLAWICARERDRWWFLLLGAFCLLAWSPYNLLDPGFQLSFAAVAAIFVLVPRFLQKLEGYPLPPRLAPVVAVSAACGLATAPILLVQFGRVPVYSVAANALAAAAVPPLLGLALSASLLHPLAPGAAQLVAWLAGWCAAWLALVARLVAGLPHPQLDGQEALLAGVLTTGGLLAWRLRRRASRTALAAVLVSCLAFWAAWPLLAPTPSWSPPIGLRATFLDVGQGDATLLETAAGAVLVDEGPPTADVAGVLRRRGLRSLAALVLTHPQRDHIGGAEEVVRRLRVGMVVYPALAVSSPEERRVLAEARERGVAIEVARAGEEYRLGRLRLHVLWPQGPGSRKQDPNENAIVLRASYGATDLLLTADAESEVTARLPLAPVEVLKVAHHGSRDAGLPLLLQRLRPQVAVISVGRANDYGHPSPSTLAALAAVPGLRLYRTDQDGEVVLESDGAALALAAGR
jgi:competence protein ComEC